MVLSRIFQIAGILAELLVFHRLNRHRGESLGARLRQACERLGLAFIKVGQILSTRYDILPLEDRLELQKLLDAVPPIPYSEVERIFVEDFGKLPEECFDTFNRTPMASASVSQVHEAVLRGEKVAVKMRRPGVAATLRADMAIFRWLARLAQVFWPMLRRVDLQEILSQAESWMRTETDFRKEATHIETVIAHYRDSGKNGYDEEYSRAIVFPAPRRELCSANVLTMDFLEGVLAKNFADAAGNPAYDMERSLTTLLRAVLRHWMTGDELYFHGDPHPSNVMIMTGGRLGLLDFGLLGHFNEDQVNRTRDLFLAVYAKDADRATDLALDLCRVPRSARPKGMLADVDSYIKKAHGAGLAYWFTGFIDVCIKHRVPMPYDMVLFGRMQTIIDGLFQMVLPEKTTLDMLGDELARGLRHKIVENIRQTDIAPLIYALSEKLKTSPEAAMRFVDRYFDDPTDLLRDISAAMRGDRKEKERV